MRFLSLFIIGLVTINTAWSQVLKTESVLVKNLTTNQVLFTHNDQQVRSIASITKIMTAMVTLDYDRDLERRLTLTRTVSSVLPRQTYSRAQLIEAMLIKSDNAAAETLAQDYPGGRLAFIQTMNQRALDWELTKTKFEDASGLGAGNVSTVHDIATMLTIANNYWFVRQVSGQREAILNTSTRSIHLMHTAHLMMTMFDTVWLSKTGSTTAAGWCVGMLANHHQQQWVIVTLGSRSKAGRLITVQNLVTQHLRWQKIPQVSTAYN